MKPIDSHCHLDFERFDGDRKDVIERSRDKLQCVVTAGTNYVNNKSVLRLQERFPKLIKANLGLHPTYIDSFKNLDKIKDQIRERDPVAVGEIGLDHHHVTEEENRKRQEEVFREMLSLAEELQKPVAVHSREAEEKSIDIIEEYSLSGVFLHCFNGKPFLAEKAVRKGMKLGVTTQVLYSNRVQEIVEKITIEDILLETDSPFLYRGERNEPVNILESVEKISNLKDLDEEKIIRATNRNSTKIFNR